MTESVLILSLRENCPPEAFSKDEKGGYIQVLAWESDEDNPSEDVVCIEIGSTPFSAMVTNIPIRPWPSAPATVQRMATEVERRQVEQARRDATILAGLRCLQQQGSHNTFDMFPELFDGIKPLSEDELEELCQELNCGEDA